MSGEWYGSGRSEHCGEHGEHRPVGVQPHAVDATHTERGESPLVLQVAELPLDRAAQVVQRLKSLGVAGLSHDLVCV